MLPDTETLKSLLSDLQTSGAGSRLRVATRTIESMRVELLAEVIRLREQLATVEGERDEARAEVERLRELVSPSTPEGRLAAFKSAKAMVANPPKVADKWRQSQFNAENFTRWTHDRCVARVKGRYWGTGSDGATIQAESPEAARKAADEALKSAGWELIGGSDV